MVTFDSTLKSKLIYVFRINDDAHKGCLKVGETTYDGDDLTGYNTPNSAALNAAAKARIDSYTSTAGIAYELLYTEGTLHARDGKFTSFNDKDVHNCLLNSGVKKKVFDNVNGANEWFITSLETVKNAIAAIKRGDTAMTANMVNPNVPDPIIFRPEQREAIDRTKKTFSKSKAMLWNAKMHFGKTVSALQLIKEMGFTRTIILTHRPVVNDGWYEDFGKIFYDAPQYVYGSKNGKGEKDIKVLEKHANEGKKKYIWFASMQDMRGSETVGGKFDKNDEVFSIEWDLLIIDEAHEGTQTELGIAVIEELQKNSKTKVLNLTGTAFNLMDHFDERNTYTWDYIMEQTAKRDWDLTHQGDPNPYACLPKMNIWTYNLGTVMLNFSEEDEVAFNFREFLRTSTGIDGREHFVYEADVVNFLNLMSHTSDTSLYPFSTQQYRDIFNHTLWMVPGVKAAAAMADLLRKHDVFSYFNVVNVAGDGDEEKESSDALEAVQSAIAENKYTITLSCGRLTTGVSVPDWTAVMLLAGSASTSASSYMQTIFRVQTPATIDGKMKTECYVFDFAPDRTLRIITETMKASAKPGETSEQDRTRMGEFLNFCPVIGIEGSTMAAYSTDTLLQQLKRVYVERVVRSGFEDMKLYNDELLKLDELQLKDFDGLKKIIGTTAAMGKTKDIDINKQGLTNEQYEEQKAIEKKPKKQRTPEEQKRLEELKAKQSQRKNAISILRGISIRMPLLIYGANIKDEDKELTIDNFTSLVDDPSWEEFMPKGVTKAEFNKFKRYYDEDIFNAAGKRIRALARAADKLSVEERIERITDIFSTFRNPDKETVLTPWRVVNMHLADTLGGWCFYNEEYTQTLSEPRHVEHENVTSDVFNPYTHILEINSKTGLYPLYAAYSVYKARLAQTFLPVDTIEEQQKLWDLACKEDIFVICKTPMAQAITRRTLVGFRNAEVNAKYFPNLIKTIKTEPDKFITKVKQGKSFWNRNENNNMKFNAIIGNPPYQMTTVGTSDAPVYHLFMDAAFKTGTLASLITPARFLFNAGKTPKEFNERVLNDPHFKVIWYKTKSTDVFPNVDIKGGICVTLRNKDVEYGKLISFTHYKELNGILSKTIEHDGFTTIMDSILLQNKFNLEALYEDYPQYKNFIGSGGRERRLTTSIFSQLDVFQKEKREGDICILGLTGNNDRTYRYIPRKYVEDNGNLYKYKVTVPKSNGTGAIGEVLSTPLIGEPLIGEPLIGYTQSFIGIGSFNTQQEAEACLKYVKSQFMRTLLGVLKVTQDNNTDVWRYVPLQDFTSSSDIDWSKSIDKIDEQLFDKYGLTDEERAFIRRMIKPME